MLRLYDYPDSGNGYKVRLALAQLERAYEFIEVDILQGESHTPEFLEKNPDGRVPVLELDDGTCLPESNAILFYLSEGTALLPDDTLARAQCLRWMFFEQYSHEPAIAVARFIMRHTAEDDTRRALLPEKRDKGYAALLVMERHLRDHAFFVGEQYSIADIALYAYTHVAHEGGMSLEHFPAVTHWLDSVRRQPNHVPMQR